MQPLQRQETHSSLQSWWSDSNPMLRLTGPTVNLHAMAKPLMRFMYHRQALGFVEKNRDAPLSAELLEIYSSYLLCKYVSRRTQRLVLDHLLSRFSRTAHLVGHSAQDILCFPALDQILYILGSSDAPGSSQAINTLIAALAISNLNLSRSSYCLERGIFSQVFYFDLPETEAAISEVMHVLRSQEGPAAAQALLKSANTSVRQFTLKLIAAFADRVMSVAAVPPASLIVLTENWAKLLSDENYSVQIASISALSHIAEHPDGSRAIVAANILDDPLQHSFVSNISSRIGGGAWCWLIESLAQHDFTIPHILHSNVIDKLVCKASPTVTVLLPSSSAVSALTAISRHPQGAAAVLAAMSEMDFSNLQVATSLRIVDQTYFTQEVCRLISVLAKDRNSASVLLRSSHLAAALENLLRSGLSGSGWSYERKFFAAASSLIQLHKWSGPEKLGNIVAAIRQGAATAKFSLEDETTLLEEIREAETFQL